MITAPRGDGLNDQKSNPEILPLLGFSDLATVKLDFDETTFRVARYWAARALYWFDLGGYVILRSSKNHYHVVFDRPVDWVENLHIIGWVAEQSGYPKGLLRYLCMQCIKESSTLRVVPKGDKPSPRLVHRVGSQSGRIAVFLNRRDLIKSIWRRANCS